MSQANSTRSSVNLTGGGFKENSISATIKQAQYKASARTTHRYDFALFVPPAFHQQVSFFAFSSLFIAIPLV